MHVVMSNKLNTTVYMYVAAHFISGREESVGHFLEVGGLPGIDEAEHLVEHLLVNIVDLNPVLQALLHGVLKHGAEDWGAGWERRGGEGRGGEGRGGEGGVRGYIVLHFSRMESLAH